MYVEHDGTGFGRICQKAIHHHVCRQSKLLELRLRRNSQIGIVQNVLERAAMGNNSKTVLLAQRLQSPGPPLHVALDWIHEASNRAAVAALLAGDLFLARYAGYFFTKAFIPQRRAYLLDAANLDIQPSRVCIHCWHLQRQLIEESEGHVFFECPRYTAARAHYINEVTEPTRAQLHAVGDSVKKLIVALGSFAAQDWDAFGRFAGRIRQVRRRMRQQFETLSNKLAKRAYAQQRIQWRSRGRFVCRHGVFFVESLDCPCLSPMRADPGAWTSARKMPHLCHELKAIVTIPFELGAFERLGVIQSRARRMDY
jgi:hypothetical protein